VLIGAAADISDSLSSSSYDSLNLEGCRLFVRTKINMDTASMVVDSDFDCCTRLFIKSHDRLTEIKISAIELNKLNEVLDPREYIYSDETTLLSKEVDGFLYYYYTKPTISREFAYSDRYLTCCEQQLYIHYLSYVDEKKHYLIELVFHENDNFRYWSNTTPIEVIDTMFKEVLIEINGKLIKPDIYE
jgi:hypothetical protein